MSDYSRRYQDVKRFILLSLATTTTVRATAEEERPREKVFWDILLEKLLEDREIAVTAFAFEHARLEDLPEKWRHDRNFFQDASKVKRVGPDSLTYSLNDTDDERSLCRYAEYFICESLAKFTTVRLTTLPPTYEELRQNVVFWDFLSQELQEQHDIALAAFTHGHARLQDLPEKWRDDRSFFLAVAAKKWESVPERYQMDEQFVRDVPLFGVGVDEQPFTTLFQNHPSLQDDLGVWNTIFDSVGRYKVTNEDYGDFVRRILQMAPIAVRSNRELMIKFCFSSGGSAMEYLDESLARDKDFFQALLDERPWLLPNLPPETQRQYPELVTDNLPQYIAHHRNLDESLELFAWSLHFERIDPEVRMDPSFARAWFSTGVPWWFQAPFPESLSDDEAFFLWLSGHLPTDNFSFHDAVHRGRDVFQYASDRLKGKRDFMLKAIQRRPHFYWHMSEDLKTIDHVELLLIALAGSESFTHDFVTGAAQHQQGGAGFWSQDRLRERLQCLRTILQRRLASYESFRSSILVGMVRPDCSLSKLNQGRETSEAHKKRIMAFAGVPFRYTLKLFRGAFQNLDAKLGELGMEPMEGVQVEAEFERTLEPVLDALDPNQSMMDHNEDDGNDGSDEVSSSRVMEVSSEGLVEDNPEELGVIAPDTQFLDNNAEEEEEVHGERPVSFNNDDEAEDGFGDGSERPTLESDLHQIVPFDDILDARGNDDVETDDEPGDVNESMDGMSAGADPEVLLDGTEAQSSNNGGDEDDDVVDDDNDSDSNRTSAPGVPTSVDGEDFYDTSEYVEVELCAFLAPPFVASRVFIN